MLLIVVFEYTASNQILTDYCITKI